MTDRDDLIKAIRDAGDGHSLSRAVAALDAHDRARQDQAAAGRELDLGARIASARLAPVPTHELHTAATDWVLDVPEPKDDSWRPKIVAQASTWFSNLDPAVRDDGEEFAEQARGQARTLASAYGSLAPAAETEFLQTAGYLHAQAASGLPQIDQTIDPNNAPSPTPYPTEVFDNFAPEEDAFNTVEDNNHGSQISSDGAPMLQQIRQQDSSGSGFGSGPERPDQHSTGFDTSDSYAEVPLGTPGTIPTAAPGQDRQVGSAPNPLAGQQTDAGADKRQTVASYSAEDPFGYRWSTTEIVHPFHARCASAHWPDEPCGGHAHTASVAIGYTMDLDKARRIDQCERLGAERGRIAVAKAPNPAQLAAFHNHVAKGCMASDPAEEDMAVLHGFQAVVRPVLADEASRVEAGREPNFTDAAEEPLARQGGLSLRAPGSRRTAAGWDHGDCHVCGDDADHTCESCGQGMCAQHTGSASDQAAFCTTCHPRPKITGPHQLYPVERSVTGTRHQGKVPSPACPQCHSRDVQLSRPNGQNTVTCSSCGHSQPYMQTSDIMEHSAASSLDQVQQTVDPSNHPTPEDDDLPEGVAFPLNPAWQAQWQTGPGGPSPKGGQPGESQKEAAKMNGLPTAAAQYFGRMDALEGKQPHHKSSYPFSDKAHGQYLRAFNETHATQAAVTGADPISRQAYGQMTGRPDLHGHWMDNYSQAKAARSQRDSSMPMTAQRIAHQMVPDQQLAGHMHELHGYDQTDVDGMMLDDDGPLEDQHEDDHRTGNTGTPHRHDDYGSPYLASQRTAGDSGTGVHEDSDRCLSCGHRRGCDCPEQCEYPDGSKTATRRTADTWTRPVQTTDDYAPVANSPQTAPQPQSANADPQDSDAAAGAAAGREDAASGQHPAFADNSSGVSPYVSAYAEAYSAASGPQGSQDVPASMGGDSGQPLLDQEAQKGVQSVGIRRDDLSRAVNTPWQPDDDDGEHPESPDDSWKYPREDNDMEHPGHHAVLSDPDFIKGYGFASLWKPGASLVAQGSAAFEAGLYAGITDRPSAQADWLSAHAAQAARHPELGHRISRHQLLSIQVGQKVGLRVQGGYIQGIKTAGVSTDLITDGPGTSPDPMGGTPLNGPGTPPPMGGRDEAATPGGAPPYQGAPPLPGGPVVPDQVMGPAQRPSQPDGPFTNTFSGEHPENVTLAPAAPDTAAQPGYSNPDAYQGAQPDRVAKLAAFRARVQAGIATMGASK